MKKLLILFVLLISVPFAFADIDREVKTLDTTTGIEVRFMQLERSIYLNELKMERVINFISENYKDESTVLLESIHLELSVLRTSLASANFSDMSREEIITLYVDTRKAANLATAEFRQTAMDILSEEDRSELRNSNAVREDRERLSEYNQLISQKVREHNQRQYEREMNALNKAPEFVEKIRSGEVSAAELRRELANHLRNATQERRDAFEQEKENARVRAEANLERVQNRADERAIMLREQAINRAENLRLSDNQSSSKLYRISFTEGQTQSVEDLRLTLSSIDENRAVFTLNNERILINAGQRALFRGFNLAYYSYQNGAGVFIVAPNSGDQVGFGGDVLQRPLNNETRVRMEDSSRQRGFDDDDELELDDDSRNRGDLR